MEFFAPAKINLSLAIKSRRDDGFHEIETFICPITIFDRVTIVARDSGGLSFVCDDPSVPAGEENLVVRAARLFCSEVGIESNLSIDLHKEIPHGAGLGGGSSDAATVLLGLNQIFATMLSRETLSALAANLGSDVPFFIYESAAICRGRGERVEPAPCPDSLHLLLIKPPFGVPTPWAYQHWKGARPVPDISYDEQEFEWGTLKNDLELPVFEKYLFLAQLKRWLKAQPEVSGALMSGSGSTIFGVLHGKEMGDELGERVAQTFGAGLWVRACETFSRLPRAPNSPDG